MMAGLTPFAALSKTKPKEFQACEWGTDEATLRGVLQFFDYGDMTAPCRAGVWPGRPSEAQGHTRARTYTLLHDRHEHDQERATICGGLRARPDGNRA